MSSDVVVIPANQKFIIDVGDGLPATGIMRVRVRAARMSADSKHMPTLRLHFGNQGSNDSRVSVEVGGRDITIDAPPGKPRFYQWDVPLTEIPRNAFRATHKLGQLPNPAEFIDLRNTSSTPVSLDPEDIRDAKLKVLRQLAMSNDKFDVLKNTVVAQYSTSKNGKHLGYMDERPENSKTTPTFIMAVLKLANDRWDGVPFIFKAGKGMNEKRSEIRVQLKESPGDVFGRDDESRLHAAGPNEFVLRMQPKEEMYMKVTIKEPGLGVKPTASEMELSSRWKMEQARKIHNLHK